MHQPLDTHCIACGGTHVRTVPVRSAFWQGDRLVVVEGIPALACADCGEQFYEESTDAAIQALRDRGFPIAEATGEMRVAVFSFAARPPP
jgi:YgiT-type zinc finger domain-containing protein